MTHPTIRLPQGAYSCRELWFEESKGACALRARLNIETAGDVLVPISLSGNVFYFLFKNIGIFKGRRVHEATQQYFHKEGEEKPEKTENLHLLIGPYPGLWTKDAENFYAFLSKRS